MCLTATISDETLNIYFTFMYKMNTITSSYLPHPYNFYVRTIIVRAHHENPTICVVSTTNCIQGNENSTKENRKVYFQMGKYCSSDQTFKNQRRINGLQLPLNWQQIISWLVLLITAVLNFSIVSLIQFDGLKIITLTLFVILYVSHIVSHVAALKIDPAEEDLRNRKTSEVPEFDSNLHAHVIENGRCHLCNIYTSNKKTKHCGLCNKCVYEFDHHCKWLNNCIGQRNYDAFIGCVTTALFISTLTFILCILDIVWFFTQPELLSSGAQKFFNCNSTDTLNIVKFCQSSISFLTFLITLCISGIAVTCVLLHLCCFHIYISLLGVSTYEYIVRNSNTESIAARCFRMKLKSKSCTVFGKRAKDISNVESERKSNHNALNKNRKNVTNLINILIETELNKATNIFLPDNKIHPHEDISIS